MDNLNDIPYFFPAGILSPKYQPPGSVTGTHCSHLVWLAYFHFGYDLDSDSGMIVDVYKRQKPNCPSAEPYGREFPIYPESPVLSYGR